MRKWFLLICCLVTLLVTSYAQSIPELLNSCGNTSDYPGSNLLVVFDSVSVNVEESGLSHVFTHRLVKILTAAGAKGMNVVKYDYDPLSAYVEIRGITIYHATGTLERINPDRVMDYPAPARAIYWGSREKMIEVGRLEPGDAVEVFLYRKGFTYALLQDGGDGDERYIPPMKGQFYDIVPFWGPDPVKNKVYQVSVPKEKPLQYEFYNGECNSKMEMKDSRLVYSFSKKNISSWKSESRAVDASDIAPKLLISSTADWQSKSLWFYGVNEDYKSFESTPAIKDKVKELLRNAHTEIDSVTILTHWAGDEIRYSGISMGKGEGYTLHKGAMDFTDRCGVCKDKAGMLITLLRAAGFEAYPAMTMAGSRIDRIPADQFNHCVTVVKSRQDGKYHLLDPTWVPFVRELWSSAEQQQNYLMGVPGGADLAETPLSPAKNHYLRISGVSVILTDGTLEGEYSVTAEGQTDAAIRNIFTRGYRIDWANNLEKEVLKISPLAQLVKVSYDADPYNYLAGPINLHFKIRIPDFATVTRDELIFTPLTSSGFFKRAMPHLGFETSLEKRIYPFRDRTSHSVEISEKVTIDGGKEVLSMPANKNGEGPGASYRGGYKTSGNELTLNFAAEFPKRIYQAADWPSYREAVMYQNQLAESLVIVKVK
jgi:transglutaminase-like putative cysteine protease